ncbi:MAG: ABC transporter permease, partial [Acidobacteriota bacterium]
MSLPGRLYDLTWRRVRHLGGVALLAQELLPRMVTRPFDLAEVVKQIEAVGVRSANLAVVISLFTGMVMALQTSYALAAFGAKLYIG